MGTVHVVLHRSTGNYRASAPGTANTAEETYKVWWVGDGTETFPGVPYLMTIATDTSLTPHVPRVQDRMPGCDNNGRFFVVTSQDWRADATAAYTYTVTVSYQSQLPWFYDTDRPWTRITRSSQLRQLRTYRDPFGGNINWYPTDGSETPWPPTQDVGGDRIDVCGQPQVTPIPQCSVTIEYHWHRGWNTLSQGSTQTPSLEPPSWLASVSGQRNLTQFLNYKKGEVAFLGFSCSPVDPQTYIVSYRFLWDYLSHHEQTPAPNIGNRPYMEPSTTSFLGVSGYQQCAKVAWTQPYSTLFDFADLFPGDVWDALHEMHPPHNTCSTFTGGRSPSVLVIPT
jgi:hypothetical protein